MKTISFLLVSALGLVALHLQAQEAAAPTSGDPGVIVRVEEAVQRGVRATIIGVEHGLEVTARGVERGARATANGIERGVQAAAGGIQVGANATAEAANNLSRKIVGSPAPESNPSR